MTTVATYIDTIVSDVLAVHGLPTATLGQWMQDIRRRDAEAARAILLDEIRLGKLDLSPEKVGDEHIRCLMRYEQAALEGAARHNLQILARALVGIFGKCTKPKDDFMRWADIISSLNFHEITLLAIIYKKINANQSSHDAMQETTNDLEALVREEFVKLTGETRSHFDGYTTALGRTGLLMSNSGFTDGFRATALLTELMELVGPIEFRSDLDQT